MEQVTIYELRDQLSVNLAKVKAGASAVISMSPVSEIVAIVQDAPAGCTAEQMPVPGSERGTWNRLRRVRAGSRDPA